MNDPKDKIPMQQFDLEKAYHKLLIENQELKNEIKLLKTQKEESSLINECSILYNKLQQHQTENPNSLNQNGLTKLSAPQEKIDLFISLFKGRDDVFAKRWDNSRKGTSGYSPACLNEWINGLCNKPKIKCSQCNNKKYQVLDNKIIESHLKGQVVVGLYPLLKDETCHFLAIDFDEANWADDIQTLRLICNEFSIPVAIERSRSGNGAHAWFFFNAPITSVTARKFGSSLLTYGMNKRYKIAFSSYDRLFPNQDTMPKGGFGNLIALPLQKEARENNNSVFIDEAFIPYNDQWAFLASIKRINEKQIDQFIKLLGDGNELGVLKKDEDELEPWEVQQTIKLANHDFPDELTIVRSNMLYIPIGNFSQKALNRLKRLAAFRNPEFYKAQAMRLSTFNKPRIISCSVDRSGYLCLPRGCEDDLKELLDESGTNYIFTNHSNSGTPIDVQFKGALREEQQIALEKMLSCNNGVLCGTTAFGKTVVALKLIAERRVNTLILVDKINLLNQWESRINEYLVINNESSNELIKRRNSIVGKLGGGKQQLNGFVDIALLQSLNRQGEVKACVKNYGMVIIDECHHVSAFTFESVLKEVNAKYVYGLTATPTRKDGHHPIITMQCGPILYRDDAKTQAERRPFDHYVAPRFTNFRMPDCIDNSEITIAKIYGELIADEMRNQLLIDDITRCYNEGKNCLVLTGRKLHVDFLVKVLAETIPDVIALTGGMGAKTTRKNFEMVSVTPDGHPLVIVATGSYIGEGFDVPRLDTLFLAMPISWKGTLQQYAGRLHRLYDGKKEVVIYDYIDMHTPMLERMYSKRLNGYASIGYRLKGGSDGLIENSDIIFDNNSFLPVFTNDLQNAKKQLLIVSPFATITRTRQMLALLMPIVANVKIIIVTRPVTDFDDREANLGNVHQEIENAGIQLILKSNIHQKFAIVDQKIVWYGSINLMSFGKAQESVMRIVSSNIAFELQRGIR